MANPDEHALHYPLGDTLPPVGGSIEVVPGVHWLRMPLPFALDHINLWLLRDEHEGRAGWTIVDCGIADDATRAAWEQVFESVLQGLPVLRVIVTHMHPDHIGLAHWLTQRWSTAGPGAGPSQAGARPPGGQGEARGGPNGHDCRLWISATDWNAARLASQSTTGFGGDAAADFFARHGVSDAESLAKVRARRNYYPGMVPDVPRRFRRLMDGMALPIGGRTWHCIAGYGHAPEHMALHGASLGVLISGDMVLPRISTNVSVFDVEPEADPLPLFLASIDKMRALPASTLVLPSHGKPFTGLHERIGQLQRHHDQHFDDVMRECALQPRSAADLLPVLFRRPLDLHQTTFAMGESVAHLHALQSRGLLRAQRGGDGVLRFTPAAR